MPATAGRQLYPYTTRPVALSSAVNATDSVAGPVMSSVTPASQTPTSLNGVTPDPSAVPYAE